MNACSCSWTPALPFVAFPRRPAAGPCGSQPSCWRERPWPSAGLQSAIAARRHRSCPQAQRQALPQGRCCGSEIPPSAFSRSDHAVSNSASVRFQQRPRNPTTRAAGLARSDSDAASPSLQQRIVACLAAGAIAASTLLGGTEPAAARPRLTADELNTIELFKESTPSVVYITNLASKRDQFTLNMNAIPQGAGSGTIWSSDGFIVTNYHVIKGASELQVSLTGGGMMRVGNDDYKAAIVGYDEDKDVAVLKIVVEQAKNLVWNPGRTWPNPAQKLKPLKLGTSSDLQVGQRVYAIGNPFGLDHTLTTGVISGTGREISSGNTGRPIQGVIQTDAAINPGNSGGPLLDSDGSLIGVNTAIYSPSGANSGVGFAIPVDALRSSVEQIIRFGKVVRPILGISFAPDQSVEQLGVSGILVLDARKGGPAWKSGIKGTSRDEFGRLVIGDVITAFKGMPIKVASDLYRVLDKCEVGDIVDVEVLRENAKEHLSVTLEASTN